VRLKFNTSEHDLETKAKQAHKFLKKGKKIKIELILRGREKALKEHANKQIDKFLELLNSQIPVEIEKDKERRGNRINLIVKKQ
jgi:translation initiation factor IF-3